MPLSVVREAVRTRPGVEQEVPPVAPAATLVALFEECGEARLILTRRSGALPRHAGEVSLPGGRVQPGEAVVEAALRETDEEIGIPPDDVEVIGWLDPVVGRASGSVALPVIGILGRRPEMRPDPGEVEAVFDVALSELLAEGVFREERWDVPVRDRPVYFFELPHDTVWGMTARVLRQLLILVTERTGRPPQEPPAEREGTTPPGSA